MTSRMKSAGMSLTGFLMFVVAAGVISIFLIRMVPAYIENEQIKKIFQSMVKDHGTDNASIHDLKDSYSRRSSVENIHAIGIDDISFTKEGGLHISAEYSVTIPLAGNVSLLLEFKPSA